MFQKDSPSMNSAEYHLNKNFFLKLIEFQSLYNIKTDELYCLDEKAFQILKKIEQDEKPVQIDKELLEYCINEGILTEKPVKRIKTPLRQSPIPSLRYLELQITKRCNLKCQHCFVGETRSVDLTFEQIVTVLNEFQEMQGLRVLITGGEPLLHPDFRKVNEFVKDLALRKILFTNGVILNDEILKKLNVEEIQISIDGAKKGHEILRGKDTFDRAITALKKAIDCGFDVSVATVIHKGNLQEFDELENILKTFNIKSWTVDALTISGNLRLNKELWVSPKEAATIMNRYGFTPEDHPRKEGYGCGTHLLSVLATGKAAFCSFYEESPIGDINEGLENLWKRKKQIFLKELECTKINCQFINECRGGCRFRAKMLSGDEKSPDLFKCYQFNRLRT